MGGGKSSIMTKRPVLPGLFSVSGVFAMLGGHIVAISFRDSVYKKFSNDTVCWELAGNAVYGLNSFSVCFFSNRRTGKYVERLLPGNGKLRSVP
jgi:hypothetical protein